MAEATDRPVTSTEVGDDWIEVVFGERETLMPRGQSDLMRYSVSVFKGWIFWHATVRWQPRTWGKDFMALSDLGAREKAERWCREQGIRERREYSYEFLVVNPVLERSDTPFEMPCGSHQPDR